jgi:predicted ATP-binding protein involved in virulence
MASQDACVRVQSIRVKQLFGLYDHFVTLTSDRVTVIHGPNGVGKTVLLKLTNAFLKGRYSEIARVPFEVFEIEFNDNSIATIQSQVEPAAKSLQITFRTSAGSPVTVELGEESLNAQKTAQQIEQTVTWLSQIGPEEWIDLRSEDVLTAEDVIERATAFNSVAGAKVSIEPEALQDLRKRIHVHLIETQRLIRVLPSHFRGRRSPIRSTTSTVLEYAEDLKKRLETALANYGKFSEKLDQSFPERLLHGTPPQFSAEQLKEDLKSIRATREQLKTIGLVDQDEPGENTGLLAVSEVDSMDRLQQNVLSVYARDTMEKFSVLKEISRRVEILLSVLSRKFINKTVRVSRVSGLAIFDRDGKQIPITVLSSGEQHELVLLYDLLFKVQPNTLVLIDEPELSLHILWQKAFMDDLLQIIKVAQLNIILATHSPYIVGDRDDLLVALSAEAAGRGKEHRDESP